MALKRVGSDSANQAPREHPSADLRPADACGIHDHSKQAGHRANATLHHRRNTRNHTARYNENVTERICHELPTNKGKDGTIILPAEPPEPGNSRPITSHFSEMSTIHLPRLEANQCISLQTATRIPPYNVALLRQLDLGPIQHMATLRIDANFTDTLTFRPVDGLVGDARAKAAELYWQAIESELILRRHVPESNASLKQMAHSCGIPDFQSRLPLMFEELRALLYALVPERDHAAVETNLDVSFLIQQLEHDVLDLPALAKWISSLIKNHCAPVRDEEADAITKQIEAGHFMANVTVLVGGIKKMFDLLEQMKLDVANFQIKTFRLPLISETVPYFQRDILDKKRRGAIDIKGYQMWYQSHASHDSGLPTGSEAYNTLFSGLLRWLLPTSSTCSLPDSFDLQMERLAYLQTDFQDLFHLDQCMLVFRELLRSCSPERRLQIDDDNLKELQIRLLRITSPEGKAETDRWLVNSEAVALEILRTVYACCGVTMTVIAEEIVQSTSQYLLQRYEKLVHQMLESSLHLTMPHAQIFDAMTTLEMCLKQIKWTNRHRARVGFYEPPVLEDVIRRLAHVGVLHWKIWAIHYLPEVDQATADSQE